MKFLKSTAFISILLSFNCYLSDDLSTSALQTESEDRENPIVSKELPHAQMFETVYDAEHFVYPVKIISIDGWLILDPQSVAVLGELETETYLEQEQTTVDNRELNDGLVKSQSPKVNEAFRVNENGILQLLIASGEHQMIVKPDFSNMNPQLVFMTSSWSEKHITFTMTDEQQVAVSARLIDTAKLEWKIQMYRVNIPLVEDEMGESSSQVIESVQ